MRFVKVDSKILREQEKSLEDVTEHFILSFPPQRVLKIIEKFSCAVKLRCVKDVCLIDVDGSNDRLSFDARNLPRLLSVLTQPPASP